MKKYFYSGLLMALMAVLSFSLVSCDDDDDTALQYSIIGTWAVTSGEGWGVTYGDTGDIVYEEYTQINSNGTCIDVQIDEDGVTVLYGTWVLNGNKLTITYTSGILSGFESTYTINELTADTMTVSMLGFTTVLKRVSDDIINQYL